MYWQKIQEPWTGGILQDHGLGEIFRNHALRKFKNHGLEKTCKNMDWGNSRTMDWVEIFMNHELGEFKNHGLGEISRTTDWGKCKAKNSRIME